MKMITVNGEIDPDNSGIILPYEHIFIDIRNQFTEFEDPGAIKRSREKVSITNLDILSRNPYAVKDNLVIDNEKIAIEELQYFKNNGGGTVVDVTSGNIGRDPVTLKKISKKTGLNIIAGCGYYTHDTHPNTMKNMRIKDITRELLKEITEGIDNTNIRAGIIGEVGTSEEIHPDEEKVLKACALAQKETGVSMIIHTYPWGQRGFEAIKILEANGALLDKSCICHIDVEIDIEYCKKLCSLGIFIEFDNFGKEYFIDKKDRGFAGGVFARDIERVRAIKKLIDFGYINNLLLSNDICLKTLLHHYGGWGYDHLLTNIVPMLEDEGLESDQIGILIKENPRRFLSIE